MWCQITGHQWIMNSKGCRRKWSWSWRSEENNKKSQDNQSPDRDPPNIKNNGHTKLSSVTIVQCWWRYQEISSSSTRVQSFPVTKVRQILGARWQGNVTMHKLYFLACHYLCKTRRKLNGKYLTLYIRFPHNFLAPTLISSLLARLISSPLPFHSVTAIFHGL
jgi:hypothetical protein